MEKQKHIPNMDYKLKLEEEFTEIESAFALFFKEHNFKLKTSNTQEIVYENDYSELIFDFDSYGSRFGYLAPPVVLYRNKRNRHVYTVESMVEGLHNINFKKLFEEYFRIRRINYYVAYKEIIQSYLNDILSDVDFSWAENFKED